MVYNKYVRYIIILLYYTMYVYIHNVQWKRGWFFLFIYVMPHDKRGFLIMYDFILCIIFIGIENNVENKLNSNDNALGKYETHELYVYINV